jgi:3-isopropylmalate/(R)-2-methylmalate dehydratase large subunit
MTNPRTLFQKIWDSHVVAQQPGAPAILYIDRQLVHEVTSPQAFTGLRARGLKVRRPDRTVATEDHSIPTRTAGNSGSCSTERAAEGRGSSTSSDRSWV